MEYADFFGNIQLGLSTAVSPANLLYCFIGVSVGMLVGVLPGIGTLAAMSMLFPMTFYLGPTSSLIMLAGIYYGTAYGGSTTSILLNVPGEASSAVTCIDGHQMAKQGRAGVALSIATIGSFIAGSVGIIVMMLFSPLILKAALSFSSAEYFSVMLLGLLSATAIANGSWIKSVSMVLLGLLLGTVGLDLFTGAPRYTFGIIELSDGVNIVALAMGIFGLSEIISSVRGVKPGEVQRVTLRSLIPTQDDIRRSIMPILRGTGTGVVLGMVPGMGPAIAAFMSYALEKRVSKDPSRFGKGAVEGVAAPEAANNAADQTAFIPTMTLGIPSTAAMALMLGALVMHGISPGPSMVTKHPDMFWGLVMSFWIGNLMLLVLNLPLIGIWVRMLQIPYKFLYPAVVMFVCIGSYTVNSSIFDVFMVVLFGGVGYIFRLLGFSPAPLLLGFVLGPLMEEHFQRTMIQSRGNLLIFFERPISGTVMAVVIALAIWSLYAGFRRKGAPEAVEATT